MNHTISYNVIINIININKKGKTNNNVLKSNILISSKFQSLLLEKCYLATENLVSSSDQKNLVSSSDRSSDQTVNGAIRD